jgi:hypothetical protein
MVFRRPRVNVKPNVQATRPVSNIVRSPDAPAESISTSQEEQIDLPIVPTIIEGTNRQNFIFENLFRHIFQSRYRK